MNYTSPRPWRIKDGGESFKDQTEKVYGIIDADGKTVIETDCGFYPPSMDDAKLIIESVNRAELVLEMVDCLRDCWNQFSYDTGTGKRSAGGLSTLEWVESLLRRINEVKP